jgi:hypothetical protein
MTTLVRGPDRIRVATLSSIRKPLGGTPFPRVANSEQMQQSRTSTKLNSSLVSNVVEISKSGFKLNLSLSGKARNVTRSE